MSTQHITVITADGESVQITTTDPDVAREYKTLPLTTDNVVSAHVTITEE